MRYLVRAVTLNSQTGEIVHGSATDRHGVAKEVVDTDANPIFAGCDGPWAVEDAFETFWNRLNDHDEHHRKPHIVKVISVSEVK